MEGNFQIKDHKFCKGRTSPLAGIPYLRGGEDKIDQFVIWRRSSNCRPDDHTSWRRSANTIGIPNSQLTLWTSFRGNWEYFILWSALFDFKCPYLQLSPKSSYLVLQNTVRNVTFLKPKNKKDFLDFPNGFPPAPLLRRDSSAFTIKDLPCPQSWWTILMEIADLHLPETYFLQHLFTKLI